MQKQRHFFMNLTSAYTLAGMHIFLCTTCRAFLDLILFEKLRKAWGSGEQLLPSFFIIWWRIRTTKREDSFRILTKDSVQSDTNWYGKQGATIYIYLIYNLNFVHHNAVWTLFNQEKYLNFLEIATVNRHTKKSLNPESTPRLVPLLWMRVQGSGRLSPPPAICPAHWWKLN